MQYLNNYRLENVCEKNRKKYLVIESASLILKITSLILLIVLFRRFYIAIAVWVVSIIVSFFKRKLLFKYVCSIQDGRLLIEKEYDLGKKVCLENLPLSDCELVSDVASNLLYYDKIGDSERILTVKRSDGRTFSFVGDLYFYSLMEYYRGGR